MFNLRQVQPVEKNLYQLNFIRIITLLCSIGQRKSSTDRTLADSSNSLVRPVEEKVQPVELLLNDNEGKTHGRNLHGSFLIFIMINIIKYYPSMHYVSI